MLPKLFEYNFRKIIFYENALTRLFVWLGGDDVHQLCEAGEAEFLEIMALVGMASKPLHVRRLQKALQEWVQNPGKKILYVDYCTDINCILRIC